MKIGDVSRKLGLPASAIRYYERKGLLDPPARVSGCRQFGPDEIAVLRFIQLAQAAGFSLAEIEAIRQSSRNGADADGLWHSFALARRAQVRAEIAALQEADEMLSALIDCRCPTLRRCVEHAWNHGAPVKRADSAR